MSSPPAGPAHASALLLLGADVGATRARVRIRRRGPDGRPGALLAEAEGAGYNVNSSGPEGPAGLVDAVGQALRSARAAGATGPVRAVLGVAGAASAHHAHVAEVLRRALAPLGIGPGEVTVTDDLVPAFAASGTGDGVLLLAGTGSAAVRFAGGAPQERCDGMGWLLGDTGSAVWLGREVLQAAARDLDGRGEPTSLTARVLERLGLPGPAADAPRDSSAGDVRQALIAAVRPMPPARWGSFAPLLEEDPRDEVAGRILAQACTDLLAKAAAVRRAESGIVLAGSVLDQEAAVGRRVRAELVRQGWRILPAQAPVEGAVHLAARAG